MLLLLIIFHYKVENVPEMKKEFCFGNLRTVWACPLKFSLWTMPFGSFGDLIRFSQFLATYSSFQKKIPSCLDSALNFLQK